MSPSFTSLAFGISASDSNYLRDRTDSELRAVVRHIPIKFQLRHSQSSLSIENTRQETPHNRAIYRAGQITNALESLTPANKDLTQDPKTEQDKQRLAYDMLSYNFPINIVGIETGLPRCRIVSIKKKIRPNYPNPAKIKVEDDNIARRQRTPEYMMSISLFMQIYRAFSQGQYDKKLIVSNLMDAYSYYYQICEEQSEVWDGWKTICAGKAWHIADLMTRQFIQFKGCRSCKVDFVQATNTDNGLPTSCPFCDSLAQTKASRVAE